MSIIITSRVVFDSSTTEHIRHILLHPIPDVNRPTGATPANAGWSVYSRTEQRRRVERGEVRVDAMSSKVQETLDW